MGQSPFTNGQRGAALIIVLWLVVLLTLLATTVSAISLSHRKAASSYAKAVQNQERMDSAIRVAVLEIIGSSAQQRVPITTSKTVVLFGQSVIVDIERESGRIDLNAAPQELLYAAFAANGWSQSDADQMAARIVDWRSGSGQSNSLMDSAEYGPQQTYVPRHGAFEAVEELRQLSNGENISPSLLQAFTVYTHAQIPTVDAAAAPVLLALRWADREQLSGRRWVDLPDEHLSTSESSGIPSTIEIGEILRIRACMTMPNETGCREATIRLTGDDRAPLQVFMWRSLSKPAV